MQQSIDAQIGTYRKVNKTQRQSYNFLDTSQRPKQHKDKSPHVVYSDRDANNTYLDELGLSAGEPQALLTPYYVVGETDDFFQLVKYDPSLLGNPKGTFSFLYGKKYTFKDAQKAGYVGWMPKDHLLMFSNSKVNATDLKPHNYCLGIYDIATLFDLKSYVKKDTVFTYKDPHFKIKSDHSFHLNQFVYVYKYNTNKTAALVSNFSQIQASDSLTRIMGWVPSKMIRNIGQRQVFYLSNASEDVFNLKMNDTTEMIQPSAIDQAVLFQSGNQKKTSSTTVYAPLKIWNHHQNKLINVLGEDISITDVPQLKRDYNTFNFHFIFDCSEAIKEKLSRQIASLQQLWLLITEDERFKDKQFTFSASSFNCNSYYTFEKSDSFALWIDYLQRVFVDDPSVRTNAKNTLGLDQCLTHVVDSQYEGDNFQNNIIIIIGQDHLDTELSNNEQESLEVLARINARLLFFQLESKPQEENQNFVLQAKQILDDVGQQYRHYISNYIVNNQDIVKRNLYTSILSEDANIYLHDAPKHSMYTGGIVFPKIRKQLPPAAFDVAIDSLLSKTISGNNVVINALQEGATKLSFLRSQPSLAVRLLLKNDTIKRYPQLIPKINKNQTIFAEGQIPIDISKNRPQGYLLTQKELDRLVEGYKSVIPIVKKKLSSRDRKLLYKRYKAYYKQLNALLFYKELHKKNTIAELIEFRTGFKVSDTLLKQVKIKDIKSKGKLSHFAYTTLVKRLRQKIASLETMPEHSAIKIYTAGDGTPYYYVSSEKLF